MAKLLDFGLVRPSASPSAADLSGEGLVLGTPLFMSPEQARGGRELDERSDIYSLGAVAYYLLTGRPPFDEGDGMEAMIAHARDPVIPPSQFQAGIPEDLEHVVLRCLAKDPSSRLPDANQLDQALGECACAAEWDLSRAARWWRSASRPRRCPRLPFDRFSEPAGRSPFPLWATQYRAILLASLSVSRTRWGFRSPPATPRRSFLTLRKCVLDKKARLSAGGSWGSRIRTWLPPFCVASA